MLLHPERAPDSILGLPGAANRKCFAAEPVLALALIGIEPENCMALGAQAQGLQSLPEPDTV
jgi:hypothetical protein